MGSIEKVNCAIAELKKRQTIFRTEVETIKLSHARTVCSNKSCVKKWNNNGTEVMAFVTICHDTCNHVNSGGRDTIGHSDLIKCTAFNDGFCKRCGHHYMEHLNIHYDVKQVTKQVEDKAVTETLNKKVSEVEMKRESLDTKLKSFSKDTQVVADMQQVLVKLALSLKTNSLGSVEDMLERSMTQLIQDNKSTMPSGGRSTVVELFKKTLASYIEEKQRLERETL